MPVLLLKLLFVCATIQPNPRLLLTSAGISTQNHKEAFCDLFKLAKDAAQQPRVTVLATAMMAPSNSKNTNRSPGELRRRRWADARKKVNVLQTYISELVGEQIDVTCVDCARDEIEIVEEALCASRCIWVTGGNTFYLWHNVRASGTDQFIRNRVGDGALYVGCSAGAIIAGKSIETAFWKEMDDPAAAPDAAWSDQSALQAIGFVPSQIFFPHYSPRWKSLVEERNRLRVADSHDTVPAELVCLEDDGFAFISGWE